jgi:hypothetical protein
MDYDTQPYVIEEPQHGRVLEGQDVVCMRRKMIPNLILKRSHTIRARNERRVKLHKPLVKFTTIQRGITYSAIKVFNKLRLDIAQCQHDKMQFRIAFKKYLITHVFYSADEFLTSR